MSKSPLAPLNWSDVRLHYDERVSVHRDLLRLRSAQQADTFVDLLLGVSNPAGNYSADEHSLGPRVLGANPNPVQRVVTLADTFLTLTSAREVPILIKQARLQYLGISVGSEASCLLNPSVCWVANTRTVWAHLLIKHNDNVANAEEELRLYRDGEETSEMAYGKWTDIHTTLEVALTRIGEQGQDLAKKANVEPGTITYLWADAIADDLYARYRGA